MSHVLVPSLPLSGRGGGGSVVGVGPLSVAAAAASATSARVTRRARRRALARHAALLPSLLSGVLPQRVEAAEEKHAPTPCFGKEQPEHITNLLHSHRGSRRVLHHKPNAAAQQVDFDSAVAPPANADAEDEGLEAEAKEVCTINNVDGGEERGYTDEEADEQNGELTSAPTSHRGSFLAADLTASAAKARTRARARQKSRAVKGPGWGRSSKGNSPDRLSLANLLQHSPHTRSGRRMYELSEEDKKVSAYYSTILNATSRVQESIDSLLPREDEDPELLEARWRKQGLGSDEIAIRMASRAPHALNEHDAYRASFAHVTSLLEGLSASALNSAGEVSGRDGGYNSQQVHTVQEEEAEQQMELERQRDEAEAKFNDEQGEDAEADGSSDSSGDEAERILRLEKALGASSSNTSSPAKSFTPAAATTPAAAFDPTSPNALPLSSTSSSAAAASSATDPASIFRDLHSFFTGKRRNEASDAKRLHVLEAQQAQVEEGSENSRQAINESMRAQDQHTTRVLQTYHESLIEASSRLPHFSESGLARPTAPAKKPAKRTQQQSAEETSSQRMKQELLVAMLQARVSEQDELLASINVEEDTDAGSVQYTYADAPAGRSSFETKAARLLAIIHELDTTLREKQEERFTVLASTEKAQERIARMLQYADKAAMEAQEREDAARKDEELRRKHKAVMTDFKTATSAAETAFHDLTKRNGSMAMTLKAIENEIAGLQSTRQHDTARMALLRAKHQKECISIMRGQIPRHLLGMMATTTHAGGANRGAMSQHFGAEYFDDPDADRKDDGPVDLMSELSEDEQPFVADDIAEPTAAEIEAEMVKLAEEAQLKEAAEELEADARATTPLSKLRRKMDKVWTHAATHEMAYIPWQAELYNSLRPTYIDLVEESERLQAKLALKQEHRAKWEEKQVKGKTDDEAESDVAQQATPALSDEEKDTSSIDGDAASSASGESSLATAAHRHLVKPKHYEREVRTKSLLVPQSLIRKVPIEGEEDSELTDARFKTIGTNQYIADQIATLHGRPQTNQAFKNHIVMLEQDHARIRMRTTALMAEWEALHQLDQSNYQLEHNVIAPTRKRIEIVRAHFDRVKKAIADKTAWLAEREAARDAKIAAELRAIDDAAEAQKGGAPVGGGAISQTATPTDSPALGPKGRRPSIAVAPVDRMARPRRLSAAHQRTGSHSRNPSGVMLRHSGSNPSLGTETNSPREPNSGRSRRPSGTVAAPPPSGSLGLQPSRSQTKLTGAPHRRRPSISGSPTRGSPSRLPGMDAYAPSPVAVHVPRFLPRAIAEQDEQQLLAANAALEAETEAMEAELAQLEADHAAARALAAAASSPTGLTASHVTPPSSDHSRQSSLDVPVSLLPAALVGHVSMQSSPLVESTQSSDALAASTPVGDFLGPPAWPTGDSSTDSTAQTATAAPVPPPVASSSSPVPPPSAAGVLTSPRTHKLQRQANSNSTTTL